MTDNDKKEPTIKTALSPDKVASAKSGLTLHLRWGAETFHTVALEDGFGASKGFYYEKAFTPRAYPASGGLVELHDGGKVVARKPIMPEGVYEKGKPVALKQETLEKLTEELRAEYAPKPIAEDTKTK